MKISILEKILGRCIPKYRKFFFFSEILADFFLYMFFPGISVISITLALGKRVPFFWPCSQHVEVSGTGIKSVPQQQPDPFQ